jgi:hypothetical protein
MNKLFVLLLLAAAAFGVYWWKYQRPVEKRVCARLEALCGNDDDGDARDRARCEKDFAELQRTASPETMKRLDECLADAKSCVEGGGCVVGTGLSVAGDVFQQFGRGVSHALGH